METLKNFSGRIVTVALLLAAIVFAGSELRAYAQEPEPGTRPDPAAAAREALFQRMQDDFERAVSQGSGLEALSATPCVEGMAGIYPCLNIDLLSFLPHSSMGGTGGNDIWGWTDPLDAKEYALVGQTNGTAFVDVTDPENPVYLGRLPTQTSSSSWRDIKVYANHAFIVSEASGHGMQVFDLTRLRNVPSPPQTFTVDAHYSGFGGAHNIVINEDSGYAYAVGANVCSGGLEMVNIQTPTAPTDAGCYSGDGYTHDAQCVIYNGPDPDYQGDEVCFGYNEDTLTIVNVTNKASPVQISRNPYAGDGYTHQGWITEDQTYLLLGDELDETSFGHNTRTRVWDISNLDSPTIIGIHDGPNASIDHNLYTHSGYAFESNYTSGLQIYDLFDVQSGNLTLAAFFDTYTPNNGTSFSGSWSNYPYFDSGVVIVNGIGEGLFVLNPFLAPDYVLSLASPSLAVCVAGSDATSVDISDKNGYTGTVSLAASGLPAGSSAQFDPANVIVPGSSLITVTVSTTGPGSYPFDLNATDGSIQHTEAMQLDVFSGLPGTPVLVSPANGATAVSKTPTFSWNAAAEAAGYTFELATDSGFTNIVETAQVGGNTYGPVGPLDPLALYYWRVRADNACGDGAFSAANSFTTEDIPPVLLVEDEGSGSSQLMKYTDALDSLGLTYDVWDTTGADIEPGAADLAPYQAVIWFTGALFGSAGSGPAGPSGSTEAALGSWLDGGGCLFISSQDYRYDKGLTGFMTGYLGVSNVTNDNGDYISVEGQGVFTGLGTYALSYPFTDYSDPITVGNGGATGFLGNNGRVAASTKETANYKTAYLAFPWEAISTVAGREDSLSAFIDWCDISSPVNGTATGTVILQGRTDNSGAQVTAWQAGSPITGDVTAAGGGYSLSLPAGTYSMTVSMASYLTEQVDNVVVASGGLTPLPDITLLGGDVNGDGTVDILDLSAIGAKYGLSSGDPGFDPAMDINSDDIINIQDLSLAAANYGQTRTVNRD